MCVFVSVCTRGGSGVSGSEQPGFWVGLEGQLPSRLEFRRDTRPAGLLAPSGSSFTKSSPFSQCPCPRPRGCGCRHADGPLSPEGRVSTGQAGVPAAPWAARVAGGDGVQPAAAGGPAHMGLEAWCPRPPSREPDRLRAGRRGHSAGLGPGTAVPAAATSCSAWTKRPLSGRGPPGASLPVSRSPGVSAGREELPRGAVHLLQLPRVQRAHAPVEASLPGYRRPGPRSRARPTRLCPLWPPPGDHGRERPCPVGGQVGKQAWREGGSCRRSPVVQATVYRTWVLLLMEEVQGPQDWQPGATKSAQTSCRGDAAHYSQHSRGWSLRACLGQIVCTSVPIPTAEALGKVPCTITVSVPPSVPWTEGCLRRAGGRETSPAPALQRPETPVSPQTTTCTSLASRVICTAPPWTASGSSWCPPATARPASSPTCEGSACLENVRLFNTVAQAPTGPLAPAAHPVPPGGGGPGVSPRRPPSSLSASLSAAHRL